MERARYAVEAEAAVLFLKIQHSVSMLLVSMMDWVFESHVIMHTVRYEVLTTSTYLTRQLQINNGQRHSKHAMFLRRTKT